MRMAERLDAPVVEHDGRVGGGGGAEVPLPGWAISLDEQLAAPLRTGDPSVVGTVRDGACLLDLRCVPEEEDDALVAAVLAARKRTARTDPAADTERAVAPGTEEDAR